jgi:hypothetical protein
LSGGHGWVGELQQVIHLDISDIDINAFGAPALLQSGGHAIQIFL